jgi:hypothetical protein
VNGSSPLRFDRPVLFGRSLAESLEMYDLALGDLAGRRILDCPGGPGSCAAELAGRGIEIVACDPMYGLPDGELKEQCERDLARTMAAIRAEPRHFGFDLDAFEAERHLALARFLADLGPGRAAGRYVTASLPSLPFPDRSFDLVLSGHLLFSYAPASTGGFSSHVDFDNAFHEASLRELLRVARGEVRVFPVNRTLVPRREHEYVAPIRSALGREGVSSEVRPVEYERAPDGPSLLWMLRPPAGRTDAPRRSTVS